MFEWIFGSRSNVIRRMSRRRALLALEALETRNCPSGGPTISLSAMPTGFGHQVELTGSVADLNSNFVSVSFSGAASGQTTIDANGNFDFITDAVNLGSIFAVAVNDLNQVSNSVSTVLPSLAPTLSLNVSYGSGNTVTLSGTVNDDSPGGLTVQFSGVANGQVTTSADGTFRLTTQASGLGSITASVTDDWGQTSDPLQVAVAPAAPVITSFSAIPLGNNTWLFLGQVLAPNPSEVQVSFAGSASVDGSNVEVQSDGSFAAIVQMQPEETRTVTAQAMDAWGQQSDAVDGSSFGQDTAGQATGDDDDEDTTFPPVPIITAFSITHNDDGWILFGQVIAGLGTQVQVTFGGLPTGCGNTATAGADGTFQLCLEISGGLSGFISAQATDSWGQNSNVVYDFVA